MEWQRIYRLNIVWVRRFTIQVFRKLIFNHSIQHIHLKILIRKGFLNNQFQNRPVPKQTRSVPDHTSTKADRITPKQDQSQIRSLPTQFKTLDQSKKPVQTRMGPPIGTTFHRRASSWTAPNQWQTYGASYFITHQWLFVSHHADSCRVMSMNQACDESLASCLVINIRLQFSVISRLPG